MSATPPPTIEGTEAPNPFEVLWDRYKSLIVTIITAILLALIGNTVWTYMEQDALSEKWSGFNVNIGLESFYIDSANASNAMSESLEGIEVADLEAALAAADEVQKPYFHLALARKAILMSDWDRAESALAAIETGYPKHDLVAVVAQAVQARDPKKPPEDGEEKPDEPVWVDAVDGSVIALMRKQIEAAKAFEMPAAFTKREIPADAQKVKFTFEDMGSFTVALMPGAPLHTQGLIDLVTKDDGAWWKGIAVDEVIRSTDAIDQGHSLHFGFESSKEDVRSKWTTTEPSTNLVEFEDTGLSHFAGALSARPEADGKSCFDRLWVSVTDESNQDGMRVVFGYVTEGLDVLENICQSNLDLQDEDRGQGRPTENIRISAVEVL